MTIRKPNIETTREIIYLKSTKCILQFNNVNVVEIISAPKFETKTVYGIFMNSAKINLEHTRIIQDKTYMLLGKYSLYLTTGGVVRNLHH